jgi:hypothetical protein
MEEVTKYFDDLFDWEMVPKPTYEHAQEQRDSSVLSTFLSEFFRPESQNLPFPYGQQVCSAQPYTSLTPRPIEMLLVLSRLVKPS